MGPRLRSLGQQVFLVAILTVPLAFCTRSFEAFLTLKAFLGASLLWLASLLFFASCFLGATRLPRSPLAYSVLALTLLYLVSSLNAGRLFEGAFSFLTLAPFALALIFCCSACTSPEFRRRGIQLLFLTAFLGAGYGVLQYLDLDLVNRIYDLWIHTEGKRNIFSTFGNPNFLAEYLVLCFPLALMARATNTSPFRRAWLLRLLVLMLLAIVACGTRGVWMGLLVSSGLLLVLCWRLCRAAFGSLARSAALLVLLGAAGMGLLLGLGRAGEESVASRIRILSGDIGTSGHVRLLALRIALEDMIPRSAPYEALLALGGYKLPAGLPPVEASPWLGSGLSTFYLDFLPARGRHFSRLSTEEHVPLVKALGNYERLHNEYLQLLVEAGLLGAALLFATLVALPLAFLRRVARAPEGLRPERIAAFCAFVGPAVHGFLSFPAHLASTGVALIFVLGIVIAEEDPAAPPEDAPARDRSKGREAGALVVVMLLGVTGVCMLLRPFVADIVRKEVESTVSGEGLDFARATMDAGLRLEPWNGPLHFANAKKAYGSRDFATAEREARLTLHGINDVIVHTMLGMSCFYQGKRAEALRHLDDAAAMSAGDPTVLYYQALVTANTGQKDEAIDLLRRLLARETQLVEGWLLLGDLLQQSGRPEEALSCVREAAAADPRSAMAWYLMAIVHRQLGQVPEALQAVARSLEIAPGNKKARGLEELLRGASQ